MVSNRFCNTSDTSKHHVTLFARTTTMEGPGFIASATNWLETGFWIFSMVFCASLCAMDCTKMITTFVNQQSYTSLEVQTPQALQFNASVCLTYNMRVFQNSNLSDD